MGRYRVAIVEMSQLLREIVVEALRGAGDVDVVAEAPRLEDLAELVSARRPDVILTGAEANRPSDAWTELLDRLPRTRMIALSARGGATSYATLPVESRVEDISPAELIELIRQTRVGEPVN